MIPVRYGSGGTPQTINNTTHYATDPMGNIVEAVPNAMPAVAQPYLVSDEVLPESDNGKHPWAESETRPMHVTGWVDAFKYAATGNAGKNSETKPRNVRLAAIGYVNPHDVIAGATRPDIPLLTSEVKTIP